MECLLGAEEELRSITSVGSGGPDSVGCISSLSPLASDSGNTPTGCDCARRVAALDGGDGQRDDGDDVDGMVVGVRVRLVAVVDVVGAAGAVAAA